MDPGFEWMINSSNWIIIVLMVTLDLTYKMSDFDQLSKHRSFYVKTYHQSIFSECRAFPYVQRQSSMSAGDHMVDNEQGRYCHSERERSFFKIAFSWDAHDDDQLWWGGKVLFLYTIHPCLSSRQRQRWPSWTWWPLRGWSRPTSPSSSFQQIFLKHARSSLLQGLPQILTWCDPETEPFWTLEFSTT